MEKMFTFIIANYNYWMALLLMLIGLYAMIAKNNLFKKLIGMSIFQSAIILFYVSIGVKRNATLPIIEHGHGNAAHAVIHAADYVNPLPHVLMLTAIVVGVATMGVALAILQKVDQTHDTIEEEKILELLQE